MGSFSPGSASEPIPLRRMVAKLAGFPDEPEPGESGSDSESGSARGSDEEEAELEQLWQTPPRSSTAARQSEGGSPLHLYVNWRRDALREEADAGEADRRQADARLRAYFHSRDSASWMRKRRHSDVPRIFRCAQPAVGAHLIADRLGCVCTATSGRSAWR